MESKERLLEIVAEVGRDRRGYLEELFRYVPETVVREMVYMEIPKDEFILWSGTPCDTVFIILSGKVAGLDHQRLGRVYSFLDFTKMYVIGDFELFGAFSEYGVSIRTTKACRLLKISAASYLNWVRHDENALFLRLRNIVSTLTSERRFDREYVFMGCRERLKYFLTRYYEEQKTHGVASVKFEKTQSELADKIGFNKRSVQRSIASLEKDRLIGIESGKITITPEQYARLKEDEGNAQNGKI